MSRYELTLTPNYVPNWGFWEATRELLQNAIDRQAIDESFKKIDYYDFSSKTFYVGNEDTKLDKKTLLLGYSTKQGAKNQIGQYGEGFKLAVLVLLRLGFDIEIHNADELWKPKFINSKRFGERILVFDIEKLNHKLRSDDLVFKIVGVTYEHMEQILANVINPDSEIYEIDGCKILIDEKYAGKIYISGLFVQDYNKINGYDANSSKYKYGYSLSPDKITLDRDRNRINSYDLSWKINKLWADLIKSDHSKVKNAYEIMDQNFKDVATISYHLSDKSEVYKKLADLTYGEFIKKYGVTAVPVKSSYEASVIKKKYHNLVPVILPEEIVRYIGSSSSYTSISSAELNDKLNPDKILKDFKNDILTMENFSKEEVINRLDEIIILSKKWYFSE